ncbi:uncharacterized protein CC84DRAFT_1164493 [Paraphaeosphaeria sporulosa]|uniref:Uncharacterized protein n=1 Tax=Paraphaeosphaeria sporulosa TaxID=1460663 RepID=A0A177CEV2_9PLEO|nr:uncharacterized protein CC84DRAFT_1164493 [Paraphaeosphaeria sporulosa]OAG06163.1 hypothetical protein CC84DRAFT_1164493 [Paraphaeosphaeria sporulosa]
MTATQRKYWEEYRMPECIVIQDTDSVYPKASHFKPLLIDDLVPGLPASHPRLIEYGNSAEGASVVKSESDYHGKVIVSYDSATGAHEVWMAAASMTEPILKSA